MDNFSRKRQSKLLILIGTLAHMGGAERQALYLVEHLARLPECRVEVLTFQDGAALRPFLAGLNVPVHVCPYYFRWPRAKRLKALVKLGHLLRFKVRPDALLPFVGIHSKTMAQVWPFSGARFCWWNQQDEGRDLHGTAREAKILRKVSCITSNSWAGREFLVKTYGIPEDRVLVYNNGTPNPDPSGLTLHWRRDLRLAEGQKLVSMLANVTAFKDHETLLRAWAMVVGQWRERHRSNPPLLALAGHLKDQAHVQHLKVMGFDLGLSDQVRFLGAIEDTDALLLESDLVVHSSLTEGCPNAVCEGMALARPVVGTDIPGMRQALGPEEVEWLAPPGDPETLAALIIRMLGDSALQYQAGTRNRQRIEKEFSIAGMNRFFQECIETGLGRKIG